MTRTINIEHNGEAYTGEIATIESTRLGYQDHGILTADLTLRWGSSGISVGGYALDRPTAAHDGSRGREGTAFGLDQIIQILSTVGVSRWEDLKGKQLIVLFDGDGGWGTIAVGIASTTDEDRILIFKQHAASWKERTA